MLRKITYVEYRYSHKSFRILRKTNLMPFINKIDGGMITRILYSLNLVATENRKFRKYRDINQIKYANKSYIMFLNAGDVYKAIFLTQHKDCRKIKIDETNDRDKFIWHSARVLGLFEDYIKENGQ